MCDGVVTIEVTPGTIKGSVHAPPSKSYTHRFLCISMLAEGDSIIRNPLYCDDTRATIHAARCLGVEVEEGGDIIRASGRSELACPPNPIYLGDSGTTLRFMTSISALTRDGYTILTGSEGLRRRPMQELISTLDRLGVEVVSINSDGCAPLRVKGGGMPGGVAELRGDVSSQYASSILLSAPLSMKGILLKLVGRIVSRPYIDATITCLRLCGASVEVRKAFEIYVRGLSRYAPVQVEVPGDFSSSAYLLALGALGDGTVRITNLDEKFPQADREIIPFLKKMGVDITLKGDSVEVNPVDELEGGTYDLSDAPDLLPVLAGLAPRCRSELRLVGLKHTRHKETDRPSVLAKELTKIGLRVNEGLDQLQFSPSNAMRTATLNPQGDHRLFMAFVLAAVAAEVRCQVVQVESVRKSYPNFINDIRSLGVGVSKA